MFGHQPVYPSTSGDHPNKDFALMVTRYWKTLKTAENLAEKPDLTIGSCLNLAKLVVGV
jgi:hypothetical protein